MQTPPGSASVSSRAAIFGDSSIAVGHRALQLDRAADRINDTGKFDQQSVAGGLDEAAAMLLELRIDELAVKGFEAVERTLLIRSHQTRVACHIGGEDRGETAKSGHCSPEAIGSSTEFTPRLI